MAYIYNPEFDLDAQPFEPGDQVRLVGEAWESDPPFEDGMEVVVTKVTKNGSHWLIEVVHPTEVNMRTVLAWAECDCCNQWAEKINPNV